MRLAMLSLHSCPVGSLGTRDTGGMSVYIRELARALGARGHEVDIFTRRHDPADPEIVELSPSARLIHLKVGSEKAVHKVAVYTYIPGFICQLENYRAENCLEYDIVFGHYWISALAGVELSRRWQVPSLAMFHTLGAVKNLVGAGEDEPELRIVREREVVQESSRVIATTERERGYLHDIYGAEADRVSVVPCGVNMAMFHPGSRLEARRKLGLGGRIILFVGRLDPLKGLDRLIESMAYLNERHDTSLVVIGGDDEGGEEKLHLEALALEKGVAGMLRFEGRVPQEALPDYYNAADVCVLPSYYESYGLVALEALACGTPVVAGDVGELKTILRETSCGYICPDGSPRQFAGRIQSVLMEDRDDSVRGEIRSAVAQLGWPAIAAHIEQECLRAAGDYSPALAAATGLS
ncbi:glycosyltransferase [Chloroflexota bacterium]